MNVENNKMTTFSGGGSPAGATDSTNYNNYNYNHQQAVTVQSPTGSPSDDVIRSGYLKKLKGKKKYFVLRKETEAGPARLEYYANERKFRLGQPPRKSIALKACFNINRTDSKCKQAIALHTHNDCVRIAMNNENELNDWLNTMNNLCGDGDEEESDEIANTKSHIEHVWLVTALNKGLGSRENILGPYRLCLTPKELTLLKVGEHDEKSGILRFPLNVIRNVSHDATFGCFFHIEFGRLAPTGPGMLSLKTEDNNIAQNMHLSILNAMKNYSKEAQLPPRERELTSRTRMNTWNTYSSQGHNITPVMTRINSVDNNMPRNRTESTSSRNFSYTGISPPVLIHTPTPSINFSSPICSTDSCSSSYSMDFDNNNGSQHYHHQRGGSLTGFENSYSKEDEEDDDSSYVPWNPGEPGEEPTSHTQQMSSSGSGNLTLPLNNSADNCDYVESSKIGMNHSKSVHADVGGRSSTASESLQSPVSCYDNGIYLPMTPGGIISSGNVKSNGKLSASAAHSRNSSLIEENDGYVPMMPGSINHQRSDSGACSNTGLLDEAYLDMDFTRKLNLSNDDMRRMSPASSESIQSGTPSSDYPLEKVSSYLLSDLSLEDGMRPTRALSVGSRSDASSSTGTNTGSSVGNGKPRQGKRHLEAVQENFRIRAMSVGSQLTKVPRRPIINRTDTAVSNLIVAGSNVPSNNNKQTPLSSSWSGSTGGGRWPIPKYFTSNNSNSGILQPHTHISQNEDSDLMELDFTHNSKKISNSSTASSNSTNRKRSLPGISNNLSAGSSFCKISPNNPQQQGKNIESPDSNKAAANIGGINSNLPSTSTATIPSSNSNNSLSSISNSKTSTRGLESTSAYAKSSPISIKNCTSASRGSDLDFMDSDTSILSQLSQMDLKKLNEHDDDDTGYLDMDFSSNRNKPTAAGNNGSNSACKVVKASENFSPFGKFGPLNLNLNLNLNSTSETPSSQPQLSQSLKSSNNNSRESFLFPQQQQQQKQAPSNTSTPSRTSSFEQQQLTSPVSQIPCSTSSSSLSTTTPLSRILESPEKQPLKSQLFPPTSAEEEQQVTYASIQHVAPPASKKPSNSQFKTPISPQSSSSSVPPDSPTKVVAEEVVSYAQIDFKLKNTTNTTSSPQELKK